MVKVCRALTYRSPNSEAGGGRAGIHRCGPEPPASFEQFGLSVKVLRSEQVIFGFEETLGAGGGYVTGFANGDLQATIRFGPHPPCK